MWTPAERRGALLLLMLFALGTGWDLAHVEPEPAPEPAAGSAPADVPPPADRTSGRNTPPPAGLLDLNRASAEELDALPGIGPVLARRIVEQRQRIGGFRAAEDLRSVRGIGPRLFERIRPRVTAQAPAPAAAARPVQIARARMR